MHPILKVPNHFFCSDVTRKEKNLSEFEIFEEIEGKKLKCIFFLCVTSKKCSQEASIFFRKQRKRLKELDGMGEIFNDVTERRHLVAGSVTHL